MESCIYEGRVKHTRAKPAEHRFSYRVFLMYLDLDASLVLVSTASFAGAIQSCRPPWTEASGAVRGCARSG